MATGSMATPVAFDYTQAATLYNTEKYADCVAVCRTGVEAGDAKAQYLLGRCYYYGHGVDKDEPEAVRLAKLAAAQHEPLGLNFLGVCHRTAQVGWQGRNKGGGAVPASRCLRVRCRADQFGLHV